MEDIIARLATTREALDALDDAECLEGYWDGRRNDPKPGPNRSQSYVQGWFAGMGDGYHRKPHPIESVIAKHLLERLREMKLSMR